MDVWCLGDNTIDQYVGASTGRLLGGNALNVAVQLHLLGHCVSYSGVVGDDEHGLWILEEMSRAGINTRAVRIVAGSSAVTTVRVDGSGDRHFEREDFGVTAAYDPPDEDIARASTSSWVHLGMVPDPARVKHRLLALNSTLRISQDCGVVRGGAGLAVAFGSAGEDEDGARCLCVDLHKQGSKLALATMGALGSLAFDGRRWWRAPAIETNVIDTTGAGDSFIAGFVSARLEGLSTPECMTAGAIAAARTCGHAGGFPQSPTLV